KTEFTVEEADKARKRWLDVSKEIDLWRHDIVYKKIKNIALVGKLKNRCEKEIKDEHEFLLKNEVQVLQRWKQYMQDLYRTNKKPV
ncbi:hypothetical protein ILUMI_16635, partial [Ignelater luminosus]